MTVAKHKRAVIVGIFVLVGVGLLFAIILIMGGQQRSFARSITLNAIFDDVSGLQQGNNIWFAGVKVGTVKKISFNPDSRVVVNMNILASMRPYLHKDAKAKISSESFIGSKIVVLIQDTSSLPLVESGDILQIQPSLNTENMMATLQQNNLNLSAITSDLKELTGRLSRGEGSLGKLIQDESLANNLQHTLQTLNTAVGNANSATADLSHYTAKLQTKGSLANDLVTDTVVFNRLRSSVNQLKQIAQSAEAIVSNFESTSSNLNANLNSSTTPLGVLLNDTKAGADLKKAFSNLNTASKKLDEDLEAAQHNFFLRGYFRKKAKAEADSVKKAQNAN
jgi:phospholipid/cholesterol/gamma-HCH transport system substrate-binding protein